MLSETLTQEKLRRASILLGRTLTLPTSMPEEQRYDVQNIPLESIFIDKARFQPRDDFSEEKVSEIVNNFNPALFKPLIVWKDPKDGKTYVLAGHHRYEALKRMKRQSAPVVFAQGDEQKAVELAWTENQSGRSQTSAENAKYLRKLAMSGRTKGEIQTECKRLYDRSCQVALDLSFLNPRGKTLVDLGLMPRESETFRDMETMAQWIGKLRGRFEELTNSHENEIYDFLRENYKIRGKKFTNFADFGAFMENIITKRTTFGKVDEVLNINTYTPQNTVQAEYDAEIARAEQELKRAIKELDDEEKEALARELIKKEITAEQRIRGLQRFRDAVTIAQRDLLLLNEAKGRGIKAARESEMALFGLRDKGTKNVLLAKWHTSTLTADERETVRRGAMLLNISLPAKTIEERVEKRLREKQAQKEFKDSEGRVGGSRKEDAAFKIITSGNLKELEKDRVNAHKQVTKDKVFQKYDVEKMQEAGYSSGAAYLLVQAREALAAKPPDDADSREFYVWYIEMFRKAFDDTKTTRAVEDTLRKLGRGEYIEQLRNNGAEQTAVDKKAALIFGKGYAMQKQMESVLGARFIKFATFSSDAALSHLKEAVKFDGMTLENVITMLTKKKERHEKDIAIMQNRIDLSSQAQLSTESRFGEATSRNDVVRIVQQETKNLKFTRIGESIVLETKPFRKGEELSLEYAIDRAKNLFGRLQLALQNYLKEEQEKLNAVLKYLESAQEILPDWSWSGLKTRQRGQKLDGLIINSGKPLDYIRRTGGIAIPDVSVGAIQKNFAFKEVEFGNWVSDSEAREHVRHFLGAVSDLGEAMNVYLPDINRLGGLSIAFGSRGRGGEDAPMAHYEPTRKIINLSKKRGDGTIAHEWSHYFDNILAEQGVQKGDPDFATTLTVDKDRIFANNFPLVHAAYVAWKRSVFDEVPRFKRPEKYYPPTFLGFPVKIKYESLVESMSGAYLDVLTRLKPLTEKLSLDALLLHIQQRESYTMLRHLSPSAVRQNFKIFRWIAGEYGKSFTIEIETVYKNFYYNSLCMDSPYWAEAEEMFARGFETYIYEKLLRQGRFNNYLVDDRQLRANVFPQGTEREELVGLYDAIVKAAKAQFGLGDFRAWSDVRVDETITLPPLEEKSDQQALLDLLNDEGGTLSDIVLDMPAQSSAHEAITVKWGENWSDTTFPDTEREKLRRAATLLGITLPDVNVSAEPSPKTEWWLSATNNVETPLGMGKIVYWKVQIAGNMISRGGFAWHWGLQVNDWIFPDMELRPIKAQLIPAEVLSDKHLQGWLEYLYGRDNKPSKRRDIAMAIARLYNDGATLVQKYLDYEKTTKELNETPLLDVSTLEIGDALYQVWSGITYTLTEKGINEDGKFYFNLEGDNGRGTTITWDENEPRTIIGMKRITAPKKAPVQNEPLQKPTSQSTTSAYPPRPEAVTESAELIPQPEIFFKKGKYEISDDAYMACNLALTRYKKGGRGFLLADGTGFGKTRQILVIAHEYQQMTGQNVLIVTENESIIQGNFKKDQEALRIVNPKVEITTYTKVADGLFKDRFFALVAFDEAHNLKNSDSLKTIASGKLRTDHTLFATATPMDTVVGAAYFISAVTNIPKNQVFAMLGFRVETKTVDGQTVQKIVLDKNSSYDVIKKNIVKVRQDMIESGAMVRRVFPFYGDVRSIMIPLTPEQSAEDDQIWDEYQRKIERAQETGASTMNLAGQRSGELSRLNEPRKIQTAYDLVKEELAKGKQVVVIAQGINTTTISAINKTVRGTIETLVERLKAEGIGVSEGYGANKSAKVAAIADFQSGKNKVIIGTPQSISTGIDLDDQRGDAPRALIMVTASYSGNTFQQILGRVSRRNTLSPAEVIILYTESVSDRRRKEIVDVKLEVLRLIQSGKAVMDAEETEGLEQSVSKIQGGTKEESSENITRGVATTESGDRTAVSIKPHGNGLLVYGNTFPLRETLKNLGGRWNGTLKGWIFPPSKMDELNAALKIMPQQPESAVLTPVQYASQADIFLKRSGNQYLRLTGNTKRVEKEIKQLGGEWNFKAKAWEFRNLQRESVEAKFGIKLQEDSSEQMALRDAEEEFLQEWFEEEGVSLQENSSHTLRSIETMNERDGYLVARFSDDIEYDIERGWSAWQDELSYASLTDLRRAIRYIWDNLSFSSNFESCKEYVEQFDDDDDLLKDFNKRFVGTMNEGLVQDPRSGVWLVKHHKGLSAYKLNAETLEEAIEEVIHNPNMDGSGFGVATVGKIIVLATIKAETIDSMRDLHILEVEDYVIET